MTTTTAKPTAREARARHEVDELRRRIARLEKEIEASRDSSVESEFRHAVGHVLDCDAGTVLCNDCKRLLRQAMKYAAKERP